MGNDNKVNPIKFILETIGQQTYRIKLQKDCNYSKIICDNIKTNRNLKDFIGLINDIYDNINILEMKDYISLTEVLKYIISNSGLENNSHLDLRVIEDFKKNRYNPESIIKYYKIFELIYNNRNSIDNKKIIHLIETIGQLLKNNKILNDFSIKYFINFIYKIYIGQRNTQIQILDNTSSSINSNNNNTNEAQNPITNINNNQPLEPNEITQRMVDENLIYINRVDH